MNIVVVTYGTNPKEYWFRTRLNLIRGAVYNIVADNVTTYDTPVMVKAINPPNRKNIKMREITSATIVTAPPRKSSGISKVIFNEEKGTTVVLWVDGTKTCLKLQDGDSFDKEKALALCYMKRAFNNRGYFNEFLKQYCQESDS